MNIWIKNLEIDHTGQSARMDAFPASSIKGIMAEPGTVTIYRQGPCVELKIRRPELSFIAADILIRLAMGHECMEHFGSMGLVTSSGPGDMLIHLVNLGRVTEAMAGAAALTGATDTDSLAQPS